MAWCARKTSVRDANILLTGEVPGNNVMSTIKKVSKKMNNLRKQTNKQKQKQNKKTRGYPYILCYEMEVASLFNT